MNYFLSSFHCEKLKKLKRIFDRNKSQPKIIYIDIT